MVEQKKVTIDEFIEIVYPKLKNDVAVTKDDIKGDELMLTGITEVKGKKVEKGKQYKIDVPVVVVVDHRRKLRLAYIRGGRLAVGNYLSRYLPLDVLSVVMTVCPR
jgi:hypothetical protein